MPAGTVDEKNASAAALRAELPAFLDHLEGFVIPSHLSDSRSGVTAWKDQELLDSVREISPEKRMENLVSLCLQKGFMEIERGKSKWMFAAEVDAIGGRLPPKKITPRVNPRNQRDSRVAIQLPYLGAIGRISTHFANSEPGQEKGRNPMYHIGLRPENLEAEEGIEPSNDGFANHCLTTWLLRRYSKTEGD